ncbi:crAss001_48 related protein [Fusobacterium polymorphum]|uniref:crAss001_48 related protein n=1 Tax=Fusobacterium nucleatum subsp. polymorphum TaxID=76857 RepID=UPI0030083A37
MESFVERMIVEKDELQDKVTKLENFVNGEKFRELRGLEQVYLKEQLKFMRGYLSVLRQRINFYNK